MKVIILFFIVIAASFSCYAQQDTASYKASNGITYHILDRVKLSLGKGINGKFIYMAWNWRGSDDALAGSMYANTSVVIKKITRRLQEIGGKTYFTVDPGTGPNFDLSIEEAIQVGEVLPARIHDDKLQKKSSQD